MRHGMDSDALGGLLGSVLITETIIDETASQTEAEMLNTIIEHPPALVSRFRNCS